MTVADIITSSFRKLGILAAGENPKAGELQDALLSLNLMLDSWQTERLMIYAILPTPFNLTAGQGSYTIGPGGNFNLSPWPQKIDQITLTYPNSATGLPLTLPVQIVDLDQYNEFVVPGTTSTIPLYAYLDMNYPLTTMRLYPVPSLVYPINLFVWTAIQQFTATTQTVVLPPGYARAIIYNLAIEIADEYAKEPSQVTVAKAIAAKAAVKSVNISPIYMSTDSALIPHAGGYNYLTDEGA